MWRDAIELSSLTPLRIIGIFSMAIKGTVCCQTDAFVEEADTG
jgi:hypothetical protein